MHPEDDTPPQRPRWLAAALIVAVVVVVAGMLMVGWRTLQAGSSEGKATPSSDATTASTSTVVAAASLTTPATLAAGMAAVNASDCIRCHGVDRRYVGPAFNQVAARYQGRPDAVDYLAGKIRNGGAGEWGRAIMPRHPQLSEEQARQMAQWVMSLPPASP